MSEIDSPSNIPTQPTETTKRVSAAATTSDDSSAQQQSTQKKPSGSDNSSEIKEKTTNYDSAVTLSVRLSSLDVGSKITANYQGVDGQGRPIITSETGTYVVKYDPKYQQDIDKLPPKASLNITIVKIDRDIEARLTYQDPARPNNAAAKISVPITLELTGLGNQPATVKVSPQENHNPLEQQKIFYQTTGLYRAESIAQQNAQKLNELPLPTSTTNYTLYERAVPNPPPAATTIPRISPNALIAQEQISPKNLVQNLGPNLVQNLGNNPPLAPPLNLLSAAASPPDTNGGIIERGNIIENQVERLLHNNITATVVKNFPKEALNLPVIVQKYIGPSDLLDNIRAGSRFTLQIESIAIPDIRIPISTPAAATNTTSVNTASETTVSVKDNGPSNPTSNTVTNAASSADTTPTTGSAVNAAPNSIANAAPSLNIQNTQTIAENTSKNIGPSRPDFSGIIIAPKQHMSPKANPELSAQAQAHTHALATATSSQKANSRYPDRYTEAAPKGGAATNAINTLYVATPVSVIKFDSPIALTPGTVINFTLPDITASSVMAQGAAVISQETGKSPFIEKGQIAHKAQAIPENQAPITENIRPNAQTGAAASQIFQPLSAQDLAAPQPPQPLENFLQNWQSLSQIASLMPTTEGSAILQTLNNRVPNIQNPGQMTSSMMFFFAALGAASPARVWLGPAISTRLEEGGHKKILDILDHDMQRITRLGAEVPRHEWRPALIPLQVGADITAIPILTRQIQDEASDKKKDSGDNEEEKKSATRFIVELELTRFGQIQVDGLLSPQKLNIIIRTKALLAPDLKTKMSGIFTSALEASGYTGDLQFKDNIPPELSVRNIIAQKNHLSQPLSH